jgi:hypothetical protein
LSWNPSGTQVAVGLSAGLKHKGWCRHQAVPLTVWSLAENLLKKGSLHEIPFDSCTSILRFHPGLGNLLAVGFYNGEVALLDFNGLDKEPRLEDISNLKTRERETFSQNRGNFLKS